MKRAKGKITRPPEHTGRFIFVKPNPKRKLNAAERGSYPVEQPDPELEPEPEPEPVKRSPSEILSAILYRKTKKTQDALIKLYREKYNNPQRKPDESPKKTE